MLFQKIGVGRKREAAANRDGQLVSRVGKLFTSGIRARTASLLEITVSLSLFPAWLKVPVLRAAAQRARVCGCCYTLLCSCHPSLVIQVLGNMHISFLSSPWSKTALKHCTQLVFHTGQMDVFLSMEMSAVYRTDCEIIYWSVSSLIDVWWAILFSEEDLFLERNQREPLCSSFYKTSATGQERMDPGCGNHLG